MEQEQGSELNFEAPMEMAEIQKKPIEITPDKVIIMGVEIPRNPDPEHGSLEELRIPEAKQFENVVIDEHFLHLLQLIARGIALNQPTLIEGEAAIGKSFAIEYLAYLTNTPVYRMSLNGQTDTTDLIGKWIPNTQEGRQHFEYLIEHPEVCQNSQTKALIEAQKIKIRPEAAQDARGPASVYFGFDKFVARQIAKLEGINIEESEWIWQDGELPREVENGAWTVLDEANTCESQILVRLNAILERGGQLVLQENGGKVVKPKDPNKTHRTFLTCNPPGGKYRGRVPFSAEFISRFNYQSVGDLPLEAATIRNQKRLCNIVESKNNLAEIFPEEWLAELARVYTEARYKLREMVRNKKICKDQFQNFDYDQRDDIRFQEYLELYFEPGNMKKIIKDAIEFALLGKITDLVEKEKARDVVFGLIKVDEPEVNSQLSEQTHKRYLAFQEAGLIALGLPDEIRDIVAS